MPHIKVYHNPHFLLYRGDHCEIVPPTQPVATVTAPNGLPLHALLEVGYTQTQHGYEHARWFNNPQVLPHLRSTSVGDLITDGDGNLYVVETCGFQPYQPQTIAPAYRLAEAYRLLQSATDEVETRALPMLLRQALLALQHVLTDEGYPASEFPVLWKNAQPGDLVGSPETGQFRVIGRRLRPKWRAKRLLAHIPNGQVWIDSPRTWAVLAPVAPTA